MWRMVRRNIPENGVSRKCFQKTPLGPPCAGNLDHRAVAAANTLSPFRSS